MSKYIVFVGAWLAITARGVLLRGSGQALQSPSFINSENPLGLEKHFFFQVSKEGRNKDSLIEKDEDAQEESYVQGINEDIEKGLKQVRATDAPPGEQKGARERLEKLSRDGVDDRVKTYAKDVLTTLRDIGQGKLEDPNGDFFKRFGRHVEKLLKRPIQIGTTPTTKERPSKPDPILQEWEKKKDAISEDHLKKTLEYIGMDDIYEKLEAEKKQAPKKSTLPKKSKSLQGATEDVEKGLELLTTKNVPPSQEKQARPRLAEKGAISGTKLPTVHEEHVVVKQLGSPRPERSMRKSRDRLNSAKRSESHKQAELQSDQQSIEKALMTLCNVKPHLAKEAKEYLEKEQLTEILDFLKNKGMTRSLILDEEEETLLSSARMALETWKAKN